MGIYERPMAVWLIRIGVTLGRSKNDRTRRQDTPVDLQAVIWPAAKRRDRQL